MRRRSDSAWCVVLVSVGLTGCASPAVEDYATRIATERQMKDEAFRNQDGKPVRKAEIDKFLPLSYFPVDEAYAVPAQLEPFAQRTVFTMPTSIGTLRDVQRLGRLKFNVKGEPLQLTAFLERGSQRLFVPFSDLTGGTDTYEAGRYMELDPTATGIYVVDFNVAYNPYCYYNVEYECPLPPAENRLKTAIRAGEKLRTAGGSGAP